MTCGETWLMNAFSCTSPCFFSSSINSSFRSSWSVRREAESRAALASSRLIWQRAENHSSTRQLLRLSYSCKVSCQWEICRNVNMFSLLTAHVGYQLLIAGLPEGQMLGLPASELFFSTPPSPSWVYQVLLSTWLSPLNRRRKVKLQVIWNLIVCFQENCKITTQHRYYYTEDASVDRTGGSEEEAANMPCWNCSSTICRLESETAYWLTCSWEVRSWMRASSLCFTTPLSCSCRDSTCMLACWLEAPDRQGEAEKKQEEMTLTIKQDYFY